MAMLQALRVHGCRHHVATSRLNAGQPARRRQAAPSPRAQAPPSAGAAGAYPSGSDDDGLNPPLPQSAVQPSSSSSAEGGSGGVTGGKGAAAGLLDALRVSECPLPLSYSAGSASVAYAWCTDEVAFVRLDMPAPQSAVM